MCPMPDGGREGGNADKRSALSPDDLDIEDDEHVVRLDEGRYVIGTDERPTVPEPPADAESEGSASAGGRGEGGSSGESANADSAAGNSASGNSATANSATAPESATADSGAVKQRLEDDLQGTSARYGFHLSAKSEESVGHQQLFSDDVGTVFDGLLRWYAQQLTTETPVEDVLGILLTESNVRVRYSPSCFQSILEAYDLGPDDTIADLFEAVQDDRGMVFPPEDV